MARRIVCLAMAAIGLVLCAFVLAALYYGFGDLEFSRINQGQNRSILVRLALVLGLGSVLVFLGLGLLRKPKR